MKLCEFFEGEKYCGSLAENIKVFRNGYVIYYGRIMNLLDNEEMANLVLIDEPQFENHVGLVAYVR